MRAFQDRPGRPGPGSLHGYLRATKTFSRRLVDEELLATDPLARLRLPRVDEPLVIAPPEHDLLALVLASGPNLRTVLAVLMATGMRIGELTALALDDLQTGELVLARTKNRAGRLAPGSSPLIAASTGRRRLRGGREIVAGATLPIPVRVVRPAIPHSSLRRPLE
jgi:site-specific recombinase XerD